MSEMKILEIWPSESGIKDLPEDWPTLAVPAMRRLEASWRQLRTEAAGSNELKTFADQLRREWAIETGAIENLYDISEGVTVALIEQGFSAAAMEPGAVDKDPEYILSLLNDQKDALEGLFDFAAGRRALSTSYIKELHAAMTRSQVTADSVDPQGNPAQVDLLHGEYKRWPNYPTKGNTEFRYCPPEQTVPEMERLVEMHLGHADRNVPPEVEAAWLHHRFVQIHPFQDGNGRVGRALASLVLIRGGLFPLVVPRAEKSAYLDLLRVADEGQLRPLVQLVARRQESAYRRAVDLLSGRALRGT